MKLVTWNMQGSNIDELNKWHTGVRNFMQQVNIACLQECGDIPSSARRLDQGTGVYLYEWNGVVVVYYPWDQTGKRCNLAIVLKKSDQDYMGGMYVYPKKPIQRPLLCVELNGIIYMSGHTMGKTRRDAFDLLNFACETGRDHWVVAGNFNRTPDEVQGKGWIVCPPNSNTYPTERPAREIDFVVRDKNYPSVTGKVLTLCLLSDHFPVLYDL